MIAKTFTAVFGGCLVSISLMLNINYLVPFAVETRLFIGLFLSFPLWVAAMVWAYSCKNAWQAWKKYGIFLFFSIIINVFFMYKLGQL